MVCTCSWPEYVLTKKDGSRYDLKRIILYPEKINENWGGEEMLSLNECKKILNANEKGIADEQLKKIMELFYFWARIEFENYKKEKI